MRKLCTGASEGTLVPIPGHYVAFHGVLRLGSVTEILHDAHHETLRQQTLPGDTHIESIQETSVVGDDLQPIVDHCARR